MSGSVPPSVWQGVYSGFAEAAGDRGVFDGSVWLGKVIDRLERELKGLGGGGIPPLAECRDHPISIVLAMLARPGQALRILDFGGGLGTGYLAAKAMLPPDTTLDYRIVETKALCAEGCRRLSDQPGVSFHDDLPEGFADVDLVFVGSALQYIEDWRGMLGRLVALRPRALLLADVLAGDIPTFVTTQSFHGARIPVWFWNLDAFVGVVESLGFQLAWRARYLARISDQEGPLPTGALPEGYRLDHACHLLFRNPSLTGAE